MTSLLYSSLILSCIKLFSPWRQAINPSSFVWVFNADISYKYLFISSSCISLTLNNSSSMFLFSYFTVYSSSSTLILSPISFYCNSSSIMFFFFASESSFVIFYSFVWISGMAFVKSISERELVPVIFEPSCWIQLILHKHYAKTAPPKSR